MTVALEFEDGLSNLNFKIRSGLFWSAERPLESARVCFTRDECVV